MSTVPRLLVTFAALLAAAAPSLAQSTPDSRKADFLQEVRDAKERVVFVQDKCNDLWGSSATCAATLRQTWDKAGVDDPENYAKSWGDALFVAFSGGGNDSAQGALFARTLEHLDILIDRVASGPDVAARDVETFRADWKRWQADAERLGPMLMTLTRNLGEKAVLCKLSREKTITEKSLKAREAAREAAWQAECEDLKGFATATYFVPKDLPKRSGPDVRETKGERLERKRAQLASLNADLLRLIEEDPSDENLKQLAAVSKAIPPLELEIQELEYELAR
jgi:hypothetical protein